jgi:hypothetical protein
MNKCRCGYDPLDQQDLEDHIEQMALLEDEWDHGER